MSELEEAQAELAASEAEYRSFDVTSPPDDPAERAEWGKGLRAARDRHDAALKRLKELQS